MLPVANTSEEYRSIKKQDPSFIEAARLILKTQNIELTDSSFAKNGSLPVLLVDNSLVFKFFPALYANEAPTEISALELLTQNNCKVPKLISYHEIDNWICIQMTQLKGQSLKDLWVHLNDEQKKSACRQIGQSLRKIHEIDLSKNLYFKNNWYDFISEQKRNCVNRQTQIGLREDLIKQIPLFLESVDLNYSPISFLHTEVMKDHVFFDENLNFEGFIDFEPSRLGYFEYDFASVGVFLTSGDSLALKAFFEGYDISETSATKEFKRRALAYTLLHQYSNLKWYLEFMPVARTLDELADLWWRTN